MTELLEIQRAAFCATASGRQTRIDRGSPGSPRCCSTIPTRSRRYRPPTSVAPRELSLMADIAGCMPRPGPPAAQRRQMDEGDQDLQGDGRRRFRAVDPHEPLGVVGIMGPWNFPLQLTIVPAGSAFAAGNRVLIRRRRSRLRPPT